MSRRPVLSLDFDGVIHSYSSGWKGAAVIPDPPVPGALRFIFEALPSFRVAIFSSRSHQWGGRRAMKRWLRLNFHNCTERWWIDYTSAESQMDPWDDALDWAADRLLKRIEFPLFKPPALVTIDDRAIMFTGTFPSLRDIRDFQPWNKPQRPRARPTIEELEAILRSDDEPKVTILPDGTFRSGGI